MCFLLFPLSRFFFKFSSDLDCGRHIRCMLLFCRSLFLLRYIWGCQIDTQRSFENYNAKFGVPFLWCNTYWTFTQPLQRRYGCNWWRFASHSGYIVDIFIFGICLEIFCIFFSLVLFSFKFSYTQHGLYYLIYF